MSPAELAMLRVPLSSLPGFDPVGLVLHHHSGWSGFAIGRSPRGSLVCYSSGVSQLEPAAAEIDLADSATADRVARWAAAQVELATDCTAPGWRYLPDSVGWWLAAPDGAGWFFPVSSLPLVKVFWADDDRLLPDGSRYVDRLALALVAVYLGSQP